MIHQTPPAIRAEWLDDTRNWEIVDQVPHWAEEAAIERMHLALLDPGYRKLTNNCEQFARFVITGQRESFQVRDAVVLGGALFLGIRIFAAEQDRERKARAKSRRRRARRYA